MKKCPFTAIGFAAALALTPELKAQTVVAGWTFENNSVATNNNPAASTNNTTGTPTADSIGMNLYATPNVGVTTDDIVVGKSSDTGANSIADLTNTWRIRGQAGSNGPANGWSSAAPIGTQGAQFFASTSGLTSSAYSGLQISFDWYATTQGEANLELAYTTNGTTWIDLPITLTLADSAAQILTNNGSDTNTVTGSYISDNLLTGGSKAGQDWFTGLTATINNPSVLNDPNFGIEMVNASTGADCVSTQGTALNNNSGNWRFDNISITAEPVPEPGACGIVTLGAALLVLCGNRFRRGIRNA